MIIFKFKPILYEQTFKNYKKVMKQQVSLKLNKNNFTFWLIIICFAGFISYAQGYSLCTTSQSSCLICPIQCTKCNSSFTCSECALQYFLLAGSCISCPDYCLNCTSSTLCTQCQTPYVLINGTCNQCAVSNSLTCSSTVSASSCQSQYYVNSNYCSSCLLNCKTCTSSSTCTTCIDYFYLNATILTCNPCPSNCLTCNQFTPSTCTSCKSGYQINSGSTCSKLDCSTISNCVFCSSTNVCGQCEVFYYWNGTQCVIGASVLCDNGAAGPLPSQCINSCDSSKYKSQISEPFQCIPYRIAKINSLKIQQKYLYAFADQSDLQSLSSSINSIQLQSNGEYSYTLSSLKFISLSSFYKIELRIKYISVSSVNLLFSSSSQSSSQIQSQSTVLTSSSIPNAISYFSHSVHSNNLLMNFSSGLNLIQIYLKLYKCPSSCLQCLNNDLCELCVSPKYMLGYECIDNCTVYYHFALNRTCLLNCPDGYYYQNNGTNNKYCQPCSSPCANCLDSLKCLSCLTGFYFYNYTCLTSCPSSYYKSSINNTCETCISPCKTCTSKQDCLSCDLGYWNGTKCSIECPSGFYGNNLTKTCELCDSSCLTCTNSSTYCTSCSALLYLHNKKCITVCPDRYYSSGSAPLTCNSCKPPCEKCSSLTSCLSCAYNYLSVTACVASCPDGYYENLVNNSCTACSSQCLTCDDSNYCTSCSLTKCLYQGTCVSNCPSQEWYQVIDSTTSQCSCQQCKYPCKECLSSTSCISCLEGYLYNTQCLTQCPTTYYKNDTLKQCLKCNTLIGNCSECTSQKCTLCESSYLLYAGYCLSTCPLYHYEVNQKCSKCIAPCLECTSFSSCTSCIDSYIFYQNSCIINCPSGKYSYLTQINGLNFSLCGTCQSPCLYCTQTSNKCTYCANTYFLSNNLCYQNCSTISPINTYYNEPVTSTCSKCLFPCKTCQSQYECISCSIGYLNTADKTCEQCSVGTYPNNLLGICQSCPPSCVICYSSDFCTVCNNGFYLYQNTCTSNLSLCENNGYYGIGRVCSLCSQPCKTCSKASTNCTSCLSGYIFFSSSQCLSECPTGYFRNSITSTCDTCALQCTSCLATSTYCFSCAINFKLYTGEMKCVSSCPQHTYTQGGFCSSCKYPCLQCNSESSCLSCISGTLTGTQCLSSCGSGYFSNSSNMCQTCSSSCKQCSITASNCTQCPSGSYLTSSQCVSTCPSKTFAETTSSKCISCLGTCYQCQDHVNCTSCSGGLYFYISTVTNYGQCVTKCPNGYFPTGSTCQSCKASCLTCDNATSCILCNGGNVMYLGQCYTQCPQKMYSFQGVCQNCQSPCYNCSDTTTCTSCTNNSYLLVGSAQCIQGPNCPVGYFLLDGQLKCNSQCPTGYYHLQSNRTCNIGGCDSDEFKSPSNFYCYSQCPSGYKGNSLLQCQACNGVECSNGLYFSVSYLIKNDDLIVTIRFTETPIYRIANPIMLITPSITYVLNQSYANVSSTSISEQTPPISSTSSVGTTGSTQLVLYFKPTDSLQQTYFKIKFQNPLQTFSNPIQHSSTTFYLEGYDYYDNTDLKDMSTLGILTLACAFIGLVKNPFITDFAQILYVLALSNLHYPLHLRSFLQSTQIAFLHGFISIAQSDIDGKGKFSYLVNNGLFQNAFGNILIILIGLIIALLLFGLLKILSHCTEYGKVSSVSPNEQRFISALNNQVSHSVNLNANQNSERPTSLQQKSIPLSLKIQNLLISLFVPYTFNFQYLNRFIYFNYLPICLFTFTQFQSFNMSSSSINLLSSLMSVLTLIGVVLFGPALMIWCKKPKYTFLYIRKLVIALSLILSVNYPAYSVGVLAVCNITAILLILSYKLQKWKLQTKMSAVGQALQLILMIGFAIFIMIGEGNRNQFKVLFCYGLILLSIAILLFYLIFSIFLFTLWMIKKICKIDYIQKWIQEDKMDDSDGTDSQTLNSSMKDHQQKKPEIKPVQIKPQQTKWNKIQQLLKKQGDILKQGQINNFLQTRPIGVSPSKFNTDEEVNKELFWNYDTNSQQEYPSFSNDKDKSPPKMLIRCINQFSDFDNQDNHEGDHQKNTKK